MSVVDPKNLGNKVKTRVINWLDLAMRAWGSEFHAPDHGVYEFSNGRKWDSTDKGLTGLYGVDVENVIVLDGMQYPDMRDGLFVNDGNPTLGQELPFGYFDELATDGVGALPNANDSYNTYIPPSPPPFSLPAISSAGAFNVQVYTGDGTTSRLISGIDLSAGGVVWVKNTTASQTSDVYFSPNGSTVDRISTTTAFLSWTATGDATFSSSGVTLTSTRNNSLTNTFLITMFQKRSRMVDVIRYTGDGSSNRQIPHNLLVTPGVIITGVETATPSDFRVYTTAKNAAAGTAAQYWGSTITSSSTEDYTLAAPGLQQWANTAPTATAFSVGYTTSNFRQNNVNGVSYFAILFADDQNSDGVMRVPSWIGNSTTSGPTITLGWRPQLISFYQAISSSFLDGWCTANKVGGFGSPTPRTYWSLANVSDSGWTRPATLSATGFQLTSASADVNGAGQTHCAICVRE
jgi:hypothetical protein